MNGFKVSVCIPTYNFGEFIGETLESIVSQLSDDVEVIIGDGNSTDNTEQIVRGYQSRYHNIKYYKFDEKGGIDTDLIKTIEKATGEYCWLLSSDDVLIPGALEYILEATRLGHAIYLCNRVDCDRELRAMKTRHWLDESQGDGIFDFSLETELKNYLKLSKGLGALFSFISSIIVCRAEWVSASCNTDYLGCNYAHVHRFFSIAKNGGRLKYIKRPLILARHYNDSFITNGVANRFYIDFDGYELITKQLFNDLVIIELVKTVMRREHKWYLFIGLKNKVSKTEWVELESSFISYGYHSFQLLLIRLLGSSNFFVSNVRRIRRIFT